VQLQVFVVCVVFRGDAGECAKNEDEVFHLNGILFSYKVSELFCPQALFDGLLCGFRGERVGCRRISTAKLPGMVWLSGNNGVACWPTRQ
jgi:hypothetical protein